MSSSEKAVLANLYIILLAVLSLFIFVLFSQNICSSVAKLVTYVAFDVMAVEVWWFHL